MNEAVQPPGAPLRTAPAVNQALTPVDREDRVFGWGSQAALWFSLGVGLLVMQVGAYLAPGLGTRDAAVAIVLGSILGSALLAWTARLGCQSGLSSAGLMHATFGGAFARVPVVLNIAQLIGWTTFELVIMSEGTAAIAEKTFGLSASSPLWRTGAALLWGGLLVALLSGSMTTLVRRVLSRAALPLVVLSLLWLTWQFLGRLGAEGWTTFWNRPGDGTMGMASALDLVIAMPVSWLPLVADYSRYGRGTRGSFWGTWLGYTLANAWCYALGLLVVTSASPDASLVTALLVAQGGLIALGLILLDELDNAYGDAHSAAVSAHSLQPRFGIRGFGMALAAVCTGLALFLPMHSLEPFLLMLSSVFVPLYGVILGAWNGRLQAVRRVEWPAAVLWVLGIATFHGIAAFAPAWGSTLPTLALTFLLARAWRATR